MFIVQFIFKSDFNSYVSYMTKTGTNSNKTKAWKFNDYMKAKQMAEESRHKNTSEINIIIVDDIINEVEF